MLIVLLSDINGKSIAIAVLDTLIDVMAMIDDTRVAELAVSVRYCVCTYGCFRHGIRAVAGSR